MLQSDTSRFYLSADYGYGFYDVATNYIHLDSAVPVGFPKMQVLEEMSESDIVCYATIIEEYVHYLQFAISQFGLVFRLTCLTQSELVLEALNTIGREKIRLRTPWDSAECQHSTLLPVIKSIQELEFFKRLLFLGDGASFREPDALSAFSSSWKLLEEYTPLTLAGTQLNCDVEEFIPAHSILESHASAYAFLLIERSFPSNRRSFVREVCKRHRIGMYRSIDEIWKRHPELKYLDELASIIALGNYALAGRFFDLEEFTAPPDCITESFPGARYLPNPRVI